MRGRWPPVTPRWSSECDATRHQGLGELLITAGVVVLLFIGYQLVWTNVQADRVATAKTEALEQDLEGRGTGWPRVRSRSRGR